MTSTTDSRKAEQSVQYHFRLHVRKRKLDEYQFSFEHGQWWVIHKPTGKTWGAFDTNNGVEFEVVTEGESND